MRVFKKIMYIILALVPILPLLLFAVCNVGNTNGVDMVPFGFFRLDYTEDGISESSETFIIVEKDSLLGYLCVGVIPSNDTIQFAEFIVTDEDYEPGIGLIPGTYLLYSIQSGDVRTERFIARIAGLYAWFDSVGMTPPSYMVFAVAYLIYMLFVHVSFMIFDLIVFVPRKISEMLEV